MIDLNKIINDTIIKIENEKYVEEVMEKAIKKSIESTIDELFGWRGKLEKQLKDELEKKLELNLKDLDISSYNKVMANIIDKKLNEVIKIQGVEKIQKEMDELLKPCKDTYNFSEIIAALKKDVRNDYMGEELDGSEISLHIDADRTLIFIYFDTEEDQGKYQCKYKLILRPEDNTIHSVEIDDSKFKDKMVMGNLRGIDELLFKLYASGAKIVLDNGTNPSDYDIEFRYDD